MSAGVPYKFETRTLKEIKKPSDFPAGRCYVIQFFEEHSVHHEGDERSRTHPGHGYPAYTEQFQTTRQFATLDESEWRLKLGEAYTIDRNRTDIAALIVERAYIETRVEVKFK
jgi:hypothetical protein